MLGEGIETVVIGAGQAGLATSWHLARQRFDHIVLERGRVGETWRSERWDGFVLNTPNWSLQLPGFHYQGPDPDGFSPLADIISYLDGYAASFDAPVRERVEVTAVRRRRDRFRVETTDGDVDARNVVVAAGAYQRPTPSPLMRRIGDEVLQLHTSRYRRPSDLPDGAVLIVGSGQSGCQIADELLAAGRRVYLSVGRCPWLPRRYRGREVVHWLIETGLADETPADLPTLEARLRCNPPVSGNDGGHDCNPVWLAARGAILLGRVEDADDHRITVGPGLVDALDAGDAFLRTFKTRVDDHVRATGVDCDGPDPEVERPPIPAISELDLREAGIGTVLWATGFRPDHGWIEGVERDEQGWPVHEGGVSPIPGIFFVGLHWLRTRRSSLLFGVGADAEHVVSQLAASGRPGRSHG